MIVTCIIEMVTVGVIVIVIMGFVIIAAHSLSHVLGCRTTRRHVRAESTHGQQDLSLLLLHDARRSAEADGQQIDFFKGTVTDVIP